MIIVYLAVTCAVAGYAISLIFGGLPTRGSWDAMYIIWWAFCAAIGGVVGALVGALVRLI